MDTLRHDLGSLLDDWRQKRKGAVADACERLVFGTAALDVVAVFVCGLMLYTVDLQRLAFKKIHEWSAVLDREAMHYLFAGLTNRRLLLSAIDTSDTRVTLDASQRVASLFCRHRRLQTGE